MSALWWEILDDAALCVWAALFGATAFGLVAWMALH